ncbi:MAG TPA: ABC transporter ATP-binding protein [bacterium]|nr:ABC transporter ATP-binding protein [bacterium]
MSVASANAVVVENLEKKFGAFTAVDRISFQVGKGEIFGFLGPNGAGKSTTIRMLCGIIAPTSGSGRVGGFDILTQQEQIKQSIGYMSQRFSLYEDLTVEENINFYSGIYSIPRAQRKDRIEWIVRMAGLEGLRKNITKTLSGGWKQRLALGCALIHDPKIIFLDEPTSGVDPITRANFWKLIKELAAGGVTVFVTTHYMDEAENCGRLALIYRGSLIAVGTPREMKTAFMRHAVLRIDIARPEEWNERLSAVDGVKETALFGASVHAVAADAAAAVAGIKNMFANASVTDYAVEQIEPSLEDVFVSLIEEYDRDQAAGAARP